MKPWLKKTSLVGGLALAGIQIWPAGRTNPPTSAGLDAPPEVTSVLRRCCFDCHSNETRWPWYAHVAPVSWWMVRDVEDGRAEMNFSEWGTMPEGKRARRLNGLVEEIESGGMPPKAYRRMHADAVVSPEELEILRAWSESPQTR